uniref:Uncharacterized protein n=1 Tax=Rhizophora mucronata TaxID=61149 RepID=A0A2P2R159_RHIMU
MLCLLMNMLVHVSQSEVFCHFLSGLVLRRALCVCCLVSPSPCLSFCFL